MATERELTSIRIKQLMDEKGFSYRELSDLTKINKSSLQRYVTNPKSKLPMDNAFKIAEKLGCSISWLMGMTDDENEDAKIFASNLKKFMSLNNISIEDISKISNVTTTEVKIWLNGIEVPKLNKIKPLAEYFGCFISDLTEKVGRSTTHPRGVRIPVLGRVVAGIPIEAIEEILDYEEISESMARTGDFFALQVKGDSMEPRMYEGDVVIVRKQETAQTGDVAIVLVNGDEATVKKIRIMDSGIMLIPFNTKYDPWIYTAEDIERLPVKIIGKVVECRQKY